LNPPKTALQPHSSFTLEDILIPPEQIEELSSLGESGEYDGGISRFSLSIFDDEVKYSVWRRTDP